MAIDLTIPTRLITPADVKFARERWQDTLAIARRTGSKDSLAHADELHTYYMDLQAKFNKQK